MMTLRLTIVQKAATTTPGAVEARQQRTAILRRIISAAAILGSVAACLLAPAIAVAADQTIDEFEATQQAAWNAHDAGSYTAAFDPSAEIISALGWHWTGQAEAARNIGDGFKFVYARAQLRVSDVKVRALTPELASVTLSWAIDGALTFDTGLSAGQQHGFETQLLQRRAGNWVVLVQQDTAAAAMPGSAPSPAPAQATPPAATFPTVAPPVRRCILGRANGDCLIYGKAK